MSRRSRHDGDGLVDFPADPDCEDAEDNSEGPVPLDAGTDASGPTATDGGRIDASPAPIDAAGLDDFGTDGAAPCPCAGQDAGIGFVPGVGVVSSGAPGGTLRSGEPTPPKGSGCAAAPVPAHGAVWPAIAAALLLAWVARVRPPRC